MFAEVLNKLGTCSTQWLDRALHLSGLDIDMGIEIGRHLSEARQQGLVLVDQLHLLFLITPYQFDNDKLFGNGQFWRVLSQKWVCRASPFLLGPLVAQEADEGMAGRTHLRTKRTPAMTRGAPTVPLRTTTIVRGVSMTIASVATSEARGGKYVYCKSQGNLEIRVPGREGWSLPPRPEK